MSESAQITIDVDGEILTDQQGQLWIPATVLVVGESDDSKGSRPQWSAPEWSRLDALRWRPRNSSRRTLLRRGMLGQRCWRFELRSFSVSACALTSGVK